MLNGACEGNRTLVIITKSGFRRKSHRSLLKTGLNAKIQRHSRQLSTTVNLWKPLGSIAVGSGIRGLLCHKSVREHRGGICCRPVRPKMRSVSSKAFPTPARTNPPRGLDSRLRSIPPAEGEHRPRPDNEHLARHRLVQGSFTAGRVVSGAVRAQRLLRHPGRLVRPFPASRRLCSDWLAGSSWNESTCC